MSDRKQNDFFNSWGQQKNPIRQSDMSSMFGSAWRCQKKWGFSHLYHDEEVKQVQKPAGLGIVVHNLIHDKLTKNRERTIRQAIAEWEVAENSKIEEVSDKEIKEYEFFLNKLFTSKMFDSIRKRLVCSEKSFMVKIGNFWVAGTVDCIITNNDDKGNAIGATLLDWKTGKPPMSQFEQSHGYQSVIYSVAMKQGYFYDRPERVDTGQDYARAFQSAKKAGNLFEIGFWPQVVYAYLREYAIAKRKSKREAKHYSTKNWAGHPVGSDGKITIHKGKQSGPVYYQANVSAGDLPRLEHSLKCAVAKAKSGMFDEMFGEKCEKCYYVSKCMSLGSFWERKKTLMTVAKSLEIEPD